MYVSNRAFASAVIAAAIDIASEKDPARQRAAVEKIAAGHPIGPFAGPLTEFVLANPSGAVQWAAGQFSAPPRPAGGNKKK